MKFTNFVLSVSVFFLVSLVSCKPWYYKLGGVEVNTDYIQGMSVDEKDKRIYFVHEKSSTCYLQIIDYTTSTSPKLLNQEVDLGPCGGMAPSGGGLYLDGIYLTVSEDYVLVLRTRNDLSVYEKDEDGVKLKSSISLGTFYGKEHTIWENSDRICIGKKNGIEYLYYAITKEKSPDDGFNYEYLLFMCPIDGGGVSTCQSDSGGVEYNGAFTTMRCMEDYVFWLELEASGGGGCDDDNIRKYEMGSISKESCHKFEDTRIGANNFAVDEDLKLFIAIRDYDGILKIRSYSKDYKLSDTFDVGSSSTKNLTNSMRASSKDDKVYICNTSGKKGEGYLVLLHPSESKEEEKIVEKKDIKCKYVELSEDSKTKEFYNYFIAGTDTITIYRRSDEYVLVLIIVGSVLGGSLIICCCCCYLCLPFLFCCFVCHGCCVLSECPNIGLLMVVLEKEPEKPENMDQDSEDGKNDKSSSSEDDEGLGSTNSSSTCSSSGNDYYIEKNKKNQIRKGKSEKKQKKESFEDGDLESFSETSSEDDDDDGQNVIMEQEQGENLKGTQDRFLNPVSGQRNNEVHENSSTEEEILNGNSSSTENFSDTDESL